MASKKKPTRRKAQPKASRNKLIAFLAFGVIIVVGLLSTLVFAANQQEALDTRFTMAEIPDTQIETNYFPSRFTNRMNWLAANKKALDLRHVLHVGDLQDWDTADHKQYHRASDGLKILERASIPYSLTVGNHDSQAVCPGGSACPGNTHTGLRNTTTWNTFYTPTRLGLNGVYESGKSDNGFKTFRAGGLNWLVLNLELWPRKGVVAWAKQVVSKYPHHNVIVLTHSYLNAQGGIEQRNGGYGDTSPQYLYDNLIKQYANIRFVFSGHVGTTAHRVDTGVRGNKIYSILDCYHDRQTNPTRLLDFDITNRTVKSWVYEPLTKKKRTTGTFTISNINWVR